MIKLFTSNDQDKGDGQAWKVSNDGRRGRLSGWGDRDVPGKKQQVHDGDNEEPAELVMRDWADVQ